MSAVPAGMYDASGPKYAGATVIVLGVILIILSLLFAGLKILFWIGVLLLVAGLILNLVPVGGTRRRYY